ncbi:hypothetical protein DdX_08812 [Ditylenchus destructor]|uniref:Uncharacterized protein n=1 Tax=Ditylenchus destructor TaxID=166010 RepID=A0AAD4N315_9BILA|nr:hypothetical protein DdX_08812 [Ditylenchus destructor]
MTSNNNADDVFSVETALLNPPEYRFKLYVPSDQEDESDEDLGQCENPLEKWADDIRKEMANRHLPIDGVVIIENEEEKPKVPEYDVSPGISLSKGERQKFYSAWNTFLENVQHVDTIINELTKK